MEGLILTWPTLSTFKAFQIVWKLLIFSNNCQEQEKRERKRKTIFKFLLFYVRSFWKFMIQFVIMTNWDHESLKTK